MCFLKNIYLWLWPSSKVVKVKRNITEKKTLKEQYPLFPNLICIFKKMSQIVELQCPRIKALKIKATPKRLFFSFICVFGCWITSCNKICRLVFRNVTRALINTEAGRAVISPSTCVLLDASAEWYPHRCLTHIQNLRLPYSYALQTGCFSGWVPMNFSCKAEEMELSKSTKES